MFHGPNDAMGHKPNTVDLENHISKAIHTADGLSGKSRITHSIVAAFFDYCAMAQ